MPNLFSPGWWWEGYPVLVLLCWGSIAGHSEDMAEKLVYTTLVRPLYTIICNEFSSTYAKTNCFQAG